MRLARRHLFFWGIAALTLVLVSLPYLYAARTAGSEYAFGGFLLNPIDGNSYLAKMRQGWEGGWTFTLPYTAEPGDGAFLFLYYLFLGHLARLTGLSLLVTFHLARLLGALLMLAALNRFCAAVFGEGKGRWLAFALLAFGSGLGWLALLFGAFSVDLWVAEAYPFLSAYANAHFPLGLALQVFLLTPRSGERTSLLSVLGAFLASILLAVIAPFAVPVVLGVWALLALWDWRTHQPLKPALTRLLAGALGVAPVLLYDLWAVSHSPQLAAWNAQNQTPSPALWELLVALSPALLLAIPGLRRAWRRWETLDRLLVFWVGITLVLLYLPFGVQRRFMGGLYVPLACLAVIGAREVIEAFPRRAFAFSAALLVLSLPTNLVVLATSFSGIQARHPSLYLYRAEVEAMDWLNAHATPDSLVLAAPDTGLLLPAYTSVRVLYGHPFETVEADAQQAVVTDFYASATSAQQEELLDQWGVALIFYGPRERALGALPSLEGWETLYTSPDGEVLLIGRAHD